MATLQELLTRRKEQLGITYTQMVERAAKAGYPLSGPSFSKLINEEWPNLPTTNAIWAICAAFHLTPEDVVTAAEESVNLPRRRDTNVPAGSRIRELVELVRFRPPEHQDLILSMVRTVGSALDISSTPQAGTSMDLETNRAHSARIYDYLLGGKTHYAVDREAGDGALAVYPGIRNDARQNRAFMRRATAFLVEQGIDQFLDVGTGIPTEPNLHQVAQQLHPSARVLYVDNDPIVLAHAAALMDSDPAGAVAYLEADARNVDTIVGSAELRDVLDLSRPVGLSMFAVLHQLEDAGAVAIVRGLVEQLAPGSYVALSHISYDHDTTGEVRAAMDSYRARGVTPNPRSREQIEAMFLTGLEVIDPGIVATVAWRPDADTERDVRTALYGIVARKPA